MLTWTTGFAISYEREVFLIISLVTDLASITIWVCVGQNQLYVFRYPFLEKKSINVGNLKRVI